MFNPWFFAMTVMLAVLIFNLLLGRSFGRSILAVLANGIFGYGSLYLCTAFGSVLEVEVPINQVTLAASGVLGFFGTALGLAMQFVEQLC